jgi:hypothetical protein
MLKWENKVWSKELLLQENGRIVVLYSSHKLSSKNQIAISKLKGTTFNDLLEDPMHVEKRYIHM